MGSRSVKESELKVVKDGPLQGMMNYVSGNSRSSGRGFV
jgi:hypothetical protein